MTRQKDLKRIIRNRMSKTGESYTTARTNILAKPTQTTKTKPTPAPASRIDRAKLPGVREALLVEKTGRTWQEWVRLLDADGAAVGEHCASQVSSRPSACWRESRDPSSTVLVSRWVPARLTSFAVRDDKKGI